MFTAKELQNIEAGYFSVIASGGCTLTLQSKNTGHCWHNLLQVYTHFRRCLINLPHRRGTRSTAHSHETPRSTRLTVTPQPQPN